MKAARQTLKTLTSLTLCTIAVAAKAGTFFDDFESYTAGSNLHGQGGWVGWADTASAGALVSSAFAFSPTRSVNITGASDLVRTFSGATNGPWVFTVRQFIPSTSTGVSYLILLNKYQPPGHDADWSVQIQYNLATGRITSDLGGGATLPMVKDRWVEVKCLINLASNTVSEYYNGQLLSTHAWHGSTGVPGLNEIQALDLFANNADPVYYDEVRLTPASRGKITYTDSTSCNSSNTGWTITTVCKVGENPPNSTARLNTAVQFSPASNVPTATLTDAAGNPILVGGAVVTLVPSTTLTSAVTARYGTLTSGHVWRAFETSVDLPGAPAGSSATYKIAFDFPAPVQPEGATWVSDDSAIRYGGTVVDGFSWVPAGLAKVTYTDSTSCNANNTGWTITTVCKVGENPPKLTARLNTAVMFSPSNNVPTATLTDALGEPIKVGGVAVTLVPSAALTSAVTARYGTLKGGHVWQAFETSVDLPDAPPGSSATYKIAFSFPAPVQPEGATWVSDDSPSRYNATVVDGFSWVPAGLAKVTYTDSTSCNANNTGWTITTVCKVGENPPKLTARLNTGVQFSPSNNVPTATLTDAAGNPILVGGAVVTLVPSAAVTSTVTARYGTLSGGHVWRAFESSVDLPEAPAGSSATYKITFDFPAPVLPLGATWVTDDSSSRYNATVVDGYEVFGLVRPTLTASVSGGNITIQWSGGGLLQQSSDLVTWLGLPAATSPYTAQVAGSPKKFYRVRL